LTESLTVNFLVGLLQTATSSIAIGLLAQFFQSALSVTMTPSTIVNKQTKFQLKH